MTGVRDRRRPESAPDEPPSTHTLAEVTLAEVPLAEVTLAEGDSKATFASGHTEVGDFKEGKRRGKGAFTFAEGHKYEYVKSVDEVTKVDVNAAESTSKESVKEAAKPPEKSWSQ